MNYLQFLAFFLYLIAVFLSGLGIYSILNKSEIRFNKITCLGESLLLGGISLVGQLFILSLLHLYKNPYLWAIVFLNYAFIFNNNTRRLFRKLAGFKFRFNIPVVIFAVLLGVLTFRNLYFLTDVDSLSTYLFTQRLWLESGTSLIGNSMSNLRIFVPQFDALPYSLGISIFAQETLFPQLVGLLWRIIAVLLVFGYTKYRLNGYYALAASAFVIFNDHFFYSGANQWVIVNAAVIALIFAAAYNFWEARVKNSAGGLTFALIFISQLLANKYYLLFSSLFLLAIGILIQTEPVKKIKEVFKDKRYLYFILSAFFLTSLWYLKNFIVTGDPAFPLLAGRLHVFGWTSEQGKVFAGLVGGLSPFKLLKYASFLFIWPGVNPAKYVLVSIFILPVVIFISTVKRRVDEKEIIEVFFWLGVSILVLFGLCLATWQDPRIYRFPLALFSFTAVLVVRFIIKYSFGIKNEIIPAAIILVLSLQGYSIINQGGVIINRPAIKENIGVLLNRIHMDYIIRKHHPEVPVILEGLKINKDKINSSAWFMIDNSNAFFFPDRPVVSLMLSTTIKWDSYSREGLIVNDLQDNNIKWVMTLRNGGLAFIPIQEFAGEAVKFERSPKKTYYDYGFPEELTKIN